MRRAGQSRAKAANCTEERGVQEHLEVERCWLSLARCYELSERIGRFNDERVRVLNSAPAARSRYPDCEVFRMRQANEAQSDCALLARKSSCRYLDVPLRVRL